MTSIDDGRLVSEIEETAEEEKSSTTFKHSKYSAPEQDFNEEGISPSCDDTTNEPQAGHDDSLVLQALEYARMGWPVFPVHTILASGDCSCGNPRCARRGKHPRTKNGHKNATTNEDKIQEWWTKWPDSNIGSPPAQRVAYSCST